MRATYIFPLFLILFFFNCSDEPSMDGCGENAIMTDTFINIFSDNFTFTDVSITGNCLSTTIEYQGGCEDGLVDLELYVQEGFIAGLDESIVLMTLALNDNDACLNTITQQFDFNLSPLQSAGLSNKEIALIGWTGSLYYEGI